MNDTSYKKPALVAVYSLLAAAFIILSRLIIISNIPFTTLSVDLTSVSQKDVFQIYYDISGGLNETDSEKIVVNKHEGTSQEINFNLPFYQTIKILRLDPWTESGSGVIKSLSLKFLFLTLHVWDSHGIIRDFIPNKAISRFEDRNGLVYIESGDSDPSMAFTGMGTIYAGIPLSLKRVVKITLIASLFMFLSGIGFYLRGIIMNNNAVNIINSSMALVFIASISLPVINMGFHFIKDRENVEQRELALKPKFDSAGIPDFLKKYECYFNDFVSMRNHLLFCNSLYKYYLLGTSPVPYVIPGKDGWFFLYSEKWTPEHITIRDWMGLVDFSADDLETMKNNVESQKNYLREKGIPYIVLVLPTKETIYKEYVPDKFRKIRPTTRLDTLIGLLSGIPGIELIDARNDLLEAKKTNPVFYKTDTHWNEYGAFIGYVSLQHRISKIFPFIAPVSCDSYNFRLVTGNTFPSDLSRLMLLSHYFPDHDVIIEPRNLPGMSPAKKIKRALFIHDSFGDPICKYLKNDIEDLRESHWIRGFSKQLIEKARPDLVILEFNERVHRAVLMKYLAFKQ